MIKTSEAGGYTSVEFEREAETGDNKDIQFKVNFILTIARSLRFTK